MAFYRPTVIIVCRDRPP